MSRRQDSELGDSSGRDHRVPEVLTGALASAAQTAAPIDSGQFRIVADQGFGLSTCAECGAVVADADFIAYVFDFTFERDPALRPDLFEVTVAHRQGECRACWDSAPVAGWSGRCVRCGRGWGGYDHCPNCRGRVR